MIYKNFQDKKLSWLGMGAMRLPLTEPKGPVDEVAVMELIEHAYKSGINYYDTSYFYHSGKSEVVLGKALARFPRESWYLANKFPGNMLKVVDGKVRLEVGGFGMESKDVPSPAVLFDEQLERCGVDYFDFYMLHNISEGTFNTYTDEKLGIVDYLLEQKKAGRIKHLGFSAHGRPETIEKFLKWRNCFEFAMIQLNYLDWTLQEAGKKYEILTKYNIPVFIMEPVRGGKLASREEKSAKIFLEAHPDKAPVSWAFRFIQNLPNVPMILSGMSNMAQLKENLEIFNKEDPLTEADKKLYEKAVAAMADMLPCTGCAYCVADCPKKLDIPLLISLYNEAGFEMSWTVNSTLGSMKDEEKPAACIACGVCNPLCPQNIDIPGAIKKFEELIAAKK